MQDFKASASRVMEFIKKIVTEIGPRLPGTEEEKRAAEVIAAEYERNIGITPKREPFKLAPLASIGGIPFLGVFALFSLFVMYLYPLAGAIMATTVLIYTLTMVIVYTSIFDFLWKKEKSENFYTVQEPNDGKYDFTIMLGAHYDSSWHWTLAYKNPKTFVLKLVYGIVGLFFTIACGFTLVGYQGLASLWDTLGTDCLSWAWQIWFGYMAPIAFLPGLLFLLRFLSYDKNLASPGAMDNLTGIGINMELARYYKENPDKLPEGCRLIACGLGCEEAGLKGSQAFVKQHRNDGMLDNMYFINLDSISDEDYFEVIKGDLMQLTSFDSELVDMAHGVLKDLGLVKKTGLIYNPVGGCDSTSFHRKGVPTVTIAAQNPVATTYYHTKEDLPERLKEEVFEDCMRAVTTLIDRIGEKEKQKQG